MITVDQIRTVLQQVVESKLSLDEFDEWLSRASWEMHKDSAPDAVQTVGTIELRLAEADSRTVSEEDLVQELLGSLPSTESRNVPVFATREGLYQ
jgi:hypothetical protein